MRKPVFATAVAAVALTAVAASPMHRVPGQWEVTTSMHFTQGGMQIPPEVRAQMAAHGMKMPDFSAPRTFKTCLTAEEIAREEPMHLSKDDKCHTTNMRWSGGSFHVEFSCTMHGAPTHGTVDGEMSAGGKVYSGNYRMEGDNPQMGGHFVMQGQSSGKWLGPTCSN